MNEKTPLDYYSFADRLQTLNDLSRKLWEDSGIYDLTQKDEEGNYTTEWPDDYKEWLKENVREGIPERVNNIIAAHPERAHRSLAHQPSPVTEDERKKYSGYDQIKDYTSWTDGEMWNAYFATATGLANKKEALPIESYEKLINDFQSYYDDKSELIKTGDINNPELVSKINDLGEFLKNVPNQIEEVSSEDTDKKFIKFKEPLPFIIRTNRKKLGRGFYTDEKTLERVEDTWLGESLKDTNTDFHNKVMQINSRRERLKREDPRYQAYQDYISKRPVEFFQKFTPNKYWWDTFYETMPSLLAVASTAGAGVVGGALGGPAGAIALGGAVSQATLGPLLASQYAQTNNEAMDLYGDEDVAKQIAEGATAVSMAANTALEVLPVVRLAKLAMPARMYRNTSRVLNQSIRKKIFNALGEDAVEKLSGTRLRRGGFHILNGVKQAGLEGVQEFAQYTADALILSGYKGTKFDEEFDTDEALESLLGGIMMGGVTGSTFSAIGGQGAYTREQAKEYLNQFVEGDKISAQDVISAVETESRLKIEGDAGTRFQGRQDDKPSRTIGTSEPTLKGYLKEVVSSGTDAPVEVEDVNKISNAKDKFFVKQNKKISKGRLFEKITSTLEHGGPELVKSLNNEDKKEINDLLIGNLDSIDKNIVRSIENKDAIIEDFATGKISIKYKTDTQGKIIGRKQDRKVAIQDEKYIQSLIKKFESEIKEEDISKDKISKWFLQQKNIDISKAPKSKKDILEEKAFKGLGGIDIGKTETTPIQKETSKTEEKLEKGISKKIEQQPLKTAEQIPVGSTVAILQKNNKFSGTTGEVVKYDSVKDRVKVKLFDSEKQKDAFSTFDAKKDVMVMPDKPKTDKPKKDAPPGLFENEEQKEALRLWYKEGREKVTGSPRGRLDVGASQTKTKEQKRLIYQPLKDWLNSLPKEKRPAKAFKNILEHEELLYREEGGIHGDDTTEGDRRDFLLEDKKPETKKDIKETKEWSRYKPKGKENFEVSSQGTALGKQFSALNAKLNDGRTIEEAYQVGVKGYSSIKEGKGKPPKDKSIDTYTEYKKLWQQWAKENPRKMEDLISASKGKVLTDKFAKTDVSQARALAEIINETRDTRSIDDVFKFPTQATDKPKEPDKNKARIAADRKMAEIEQIEGVDVKKINLPTEGGLERIGDIKISKELQGKGLGENWVNSLKVRRKTQGRDTIDIIAKPGSEGFWEKQGFKEYDPINEYFNFDDDGKQDELLVGKAQLFEDALKDKDGNIKKIDGKEPTPMIFDLRDVSLQDLIVKAQTTLKDKPEYLTLPKKKDSTLKKLDEGTEKKKTKLDYIKDSANSLAKGLDDLSDITQKGAISPGGDVWDESAYNRAKEHFNDSYESAKKAYNMTLDDYVLAMFKALKNIPKEIRNKIRRFLMKWANSKDSNLSNRINQSNRALNIVELMGFGDRMKYKISREIMDSGTMDRLIASIDESTDDKSDDLTREGLGIVDTSDHEEISNNLSFEGYDFRNDTFFKFLEDTDAKGWLDRKQTAKIMEAVSSGDKDILLNHLKEKYNFTPSTINENNMIQSFWINNQIINRTASINKPSWWWANLDENGNRIRDKSDKRFIPKIGGDSRYGKDIRSNTDLPSTSIMSFVDWALKSKKHEGEQIPISRIYMKDLVDVWVGSKDETGSKYYGRQEWTKLVNPVRNQETGDIEIKSLVEIWDSYFAGNVEYDNKQRRIVRTVAEIKGGGNNPSFVVARIPENILTMSGDNVAISNYLEDEVEKGNMTSKIANDMIDSINDLNDKSGNVNKYIDVQHITSHELMKRTHGAKYLMRTPDLLHHMRRASLPYSEGIVPIGLGETTIKILDQSKVIIMNADGKKVPMTELIAGLEGRSRSDGATITDTETLNNIANSVGRETIRGGIPMREVKSVIWYNSLNDNFAKKNYPPESFRGTDYWEGIHYLAIKHNEFVADEGLRFLDSDDNTIAYTVRENNEIRIYDADDNRINRLSTLDEAKEPDGGSGSFELKGRASTDVLTLPEESTRIIKVPNQKSKSSAAFPFTWLSKLYHPEFDSLRSEIESRLLNIARANTQAMFDARKNPEIMASLYGQMKSDNTSFIGEIEQLIEPEKGNMIKDGFAEHPQLVRGILEPIKNKLINENSYKGRRKGFGNYPTVKPDYDGTKVNRYDGVAISEDDVTMVNFIKQKLNLDMSLNGEDLQRAYTEASLGGNRRGAHLLVGRFPVYSLNGVSLLKITNIVPSGHGNVTWFHPDFLAGPLQGDTDGDNVFFQVMHFGENYSDESIINNLLKSKEDFDKRKGFARVEYFKKKDKKLNAVKKESLYKSATMIGDGMASQGILTNAITFFEDMHYKGFKADIGGQNIVTRNPDKENSIMLYAPLNEDVTQEMLDEANMGKLVSKDGQPWSDGKKYLLTTPANELRLLLQAAVDHSKELLLSDWKYDGYDFIIPKMFVQENGAPIGLRQSQTISRILRKLLSHGSKRLGRDSKTRRTKGMSSMFEDSQQMFEFVNMDKNEQGNYIALNANMQRQASKYLTEETAPINSVSFNGKLTTIEKLISTPYSVMDKYQKENPDDLVWMHPFGYNEHRVVNGLLKTKEDLVNIQRAEERWYPESKSWESKKNEARRFINQMGTEFYKIHSQEILHKDATESSLTSSAYPYKDVMLDFIDKWYNTGDKKKGIKPFKELDEQQRAYSTLRFLRGISLQEKTIKNINKKQVSSIMKNMMKLRDRISSTNNLKTIEKLQSAYKSQQNKLDKLTTKTIIAKQPRIRDITTILPKQLMHPDVWRTYVEASGPNIRQAPSESQRVDNLDKKIGDYITKDCP